MKRIELKDWLDLRTAAQALIDSLNAATRDPRQDALEGRAVGGVCGGSGATPLEVLEKKRKDLASLLMGGDVQVCGCQAGCEHLVMFSFDNGGSRSHISCQVPPASPGKP